MTHLVAEPSIDEPDRARAVKCPVDVVHEGARALYIHPDGYVDRGACQPVRAVAAIFYEDDVPNRWTMCTDDNVRLFIDPVPGRGRPVASRGGAGRIGSIRVDTTPIGSIRVDTTPIGGYPRLGP